MNGVRLLCFFLCCCLLFASAGQALADAFPLESQSGVSSRSGETDAGGLEPMAQSPQVAGEPKKKRARSLLGTPVNAAMAGAGTIPEGAFLTMVNASFADKTRSKKGGGVTTFTQVWLFKQRYGITNHLEIGVVVPYINNERRNYSGGPKHMEGLSDTTLQLTLAPFNSHQGDPMNLSFGVAALLPTGQYGKNHLPGSGVWGARFVAAAGWWFTRDFKADTEVTWSLPFERGNQRVKRGQEVQWNAFARYLFDNFDIALESNLKYQESGDKRFDFGTVNLNNGYTEWFVGPSMNFAIDELGAWVGVGVFFPVMQDTKGPAKVENYRFDCKLGLMW